MTRIVLGVATVLVPTEFDRSNVLIYIVQHRFRLGVALRNES